MTKQTLLDSRLEQLGNELAQFGSCREGVLAQIHVSPETGNQALPTSPRPRWITWAGGLAMAATVLVAIGLLELSPAPLYAKALNALAKAKSIHITGESSRVTRKWPVEDPSAELKQDKYAIDAWYWKSPDDVQHSHEQQGPVVATRSGKRYSEYQSDVDLLYQMDSSDKDRIGQILEVEKRLRALVTEAKTLKDLGTKEDAGRQVRGLSISRGQGVEEYWFDVKSEQLTRVTRRSKSNQAIEYDLSLSYDLPVPNAITGYQHPVAKTVRSNSDEEWIQHVGRLVEKRHADAKPIEIVPRTKPLSFRLQYPRLSDNGKLQVIPLDTSLYLPMDIEHFLRLRVCVTADRPSLEYWRLEKGLADRTFSRSDIVCEKDTAWQDWVREALATIGLQYKTIQEDRVYWVAEHDGRPFRPWHKVLPPVVGVKGELKNGAGTGANGATLKQLFDGFNMSQNHDLNGVHPIIENKTGVAVPPDWDRKQYPTFEEYRKAIDLDKYLVAADIPHFLGTGSLEMARKWFETELGITFREEKRATIIHVIGL